jgi:hypothetical protein
MTQETQDTRVDDLRQQLRALGYLDAGVDRFVLAPARGRRGPFSVAAAASLRVSLLGAALLGPAGAIGLAGRVPGLVSGWRDAIVLALYLCAVFLAGIGVLSFLTTAGAAVVMRKRTNFAVRARRLSTGAGALATIFCLAYLTFWWRNANAGFGWSAPFWTTFALVVAVLISLLLGHAVRIATLGVLGASADAGEPLPPIAKRSWSLTAVAAVLAFAGAAGLLIATASADAEPSVAPPLAVVSNGIRLKVIAIDGVDPQLFDQTAWPGPSGDIVGRRYRLVPQDTSDPARAWTTIATGEPPAVHGVHAIETRRVAGLQGIIPGSATAAGRAVRAATDAIRLTRPSIASREERQSMMAWEVAEQAGLRTSVVNWWATWPAASRTGLVLTDRAILRLEHGGALDGEIAPPELYGTLQKQWPAVRQRALETARAAFSKIEDPGEAAILQRSAALDATIIGLANALPPPARELDVVYLPGLDIAQHALLGSDRPGALAPSVVAERVAALGGYGQFLRTALDAWLHPAPGEFVVLVTQPGRVATPVAGTLTIFGVPPRGFVDVRPGIADGGAAHAADIAPTILDALGVPLSRELAGTPVRAVLALAPARYVSAYGPPSRGNAVRKGTPLDQEMIERLRSLGYVR